MSLGDLGIYAPLTVTHPLVTDAEKCHFCAALFAPGMRTRNAASKTVANPRT